MCRLYKVNFVDIDNKTSCKQMYKPFEFLPPNYIEIKKIMFTHRRNVKLPTIV